MMLSSRVRLSAIPIILFFASTSLSFTGGHGGRYTLQVAAFPDEESANLFVEGLINAGESPARERIEIPGRGMWIRILIGSFISAKDARRYGERLLNRGVINDYFVKSSAILSKGGREVSSEHNSEKTVLGNIHSTNKERINPTGNVTPQSYHQNSIHRDVLLLFASLPAIASGNTLPLVNDTRIRFADAPLSLPQPLPRPDPVGLALDIVSGKRPNPPTRRIPEGGLWISGDVSEVMARLRWIAGERDFDLLKVDMSGRVYIDDALLAAQAGVTGEKNEIAPLMIADYLSSNEGLFLLLQICRSHYRYRLHIGPTAPTAGGDVPVTGSLNLDNNFDSRINPYRGAGEKLETERPPKGFDSLIALSQIAQWFNMRTMQRVPVSHIMFHELAEALGKVDYGLEYLGAGNLPGAHFVAIEREKKLKAQRPQGDVVLTLGSNRLLRSREEIRQFYAKNGIFVDGQR